MGKSRVKDRQDRHPSAHTVESYRVDPPPGYEVKRKPRNAQKRCFELAGRYALDHNRPEIVVVHGFAWDVPHAWVEIPGGIIYDGTCKGFYSASGYMSVSGARPVRKMTPEELANVCLDRGGVWCACPELERAAPEFFD